jgi:hypothetical protein
MDPRLELGCAVIDEAVDEREPDTYSTPSPPPTPRALRP